jgi:ferredoxin
MGKTPVLEIRDCNECGGCTDLFPEIFQYNESLGFIEIISWDESEKKDVDEAIKNCPTNAIGWED